MRGVWGVIGVGVIMMMGCESEPPRATVEPSSARASSNEAAQPPEIDVAARKREFLKSRQAFSTTLRPAERYAEPPDVPPQGDLKLAIYPTSLGTMHAYLSVDPEPGSSTKHPLVIWKTGGFSNAISDVWTPQSPQNDQSAAQFREQGLLMMYPSVRGAHDNPGQFEGYYGEVDDMLSAIKYARSLDYVDPERIYLGGHSTGGTLALLTAAAAPDALKPRAVFALGPVSHMSNYGSELPFDVDNEQESLMRAPISWLHAINTPTYMIEGEEGNSVPLRVMMHENRNPHVRGFVIPGHDHFSVIAGLNKILAQQIKRDDPDRGAFMLTASNLSALVGEGVEVERYGAK